MRLPFGRLSDGFIRPPCAAFNYAKRNGNLKQTSGGGTAFCLTPTGDFVTAEAKQRDGKGCTRVLKVKKGVKVCPS